MSPRPDFRTWAYAEAMTQGLVRYQQTGDLHFVTFSCYSRQAFLATESAPSMFEDALERMRRQYGLRYMHRNPVTRGLVSRPEEWPWPSFAIIQPVWKVWLKSSAMGGCAQNP